MGWPLTMVTVLGQTVWVHGRLKLLPQLYILLTWEVNPVSAFKQLRLITQ